MKSIISLTATLALAITFTFTACDEKKKQDGADTTATEPAAEAATQEAAAEKPAENAGGSTFTDPRDNKTYKTVKIGTQVWMAENLGSCRDDEDDCKYGQLYVWEAAMKACPKGWHLPSDKEWQILVDFAGGNEIAGKKLKATSGCNNEEGNGTDNYGFSALPGGECLPGECGNFGSAGNWWGATEYNSGDAYYISMDCYRENVMIGNYGKDNQYSVRCIKD
jgi:uncharacterized protein (TIGR02145 family)